MQSCRRGVTTETAAQKRRDWLDQSSGRRNGLDPTITTITTITTVTTSYGVFTQAFMTRKQKDLQRAVVRGDATLAVGYIKRDNVQVSPHTHHPLSLCRAPKQKLTSVHPYHITRIHYPPSTRPAVNPPVQVDYQEKSYGYTGLNMAAALDTDHMVHLLLSYGGDSTIEVT